MPQRTFTVAPRQLELREPQQRRLGLWSKWIIHDYVSVIAFGIGSICCKTCPPEQRLWI